MFPQGGPGVALLLLRLSVVAFVIIIALSHTGPFHRLAMAAAVLISTSLLIGFLTPFLSAVAVALVIGHMIINPQASSVIGVIAIANSIALGLLGPGAYSLDSKLFGRRVTVVRPRNGGRQIML